MFEFDIQYLRFSLRCSHLLYLPQMTRLRNYFSRFRAKTATSILAQGSKETNFFIYYFHAVETSYNILRTRVTVRAVDESSELEMRRGGVDLEARLFH